MLGREEITDMGIARIADLREIPAPGRPIRYILAEWGSHAWDWVVWATNGAEYAWVFVTGELLEQSALSEQVVWDIAVEDCVHYLARLQPV